MNQIQLTRRKEQERQASTFGRLPRHWRTLDLDASAAPFFSIQFHKAEVDLLFFTKLTKLGTPHDITLQELRIESFFPADEATEAAMRLLADG